jgi:hypothetical protein
MSSVTYKNQPGIEKTKGKIPLAGTEHLYTVSRVLWPDAVENYLRERLIGSTLHVCPGKSMLGDIRMDLFEDVVDVRGDAAKLPFAANAFDTVLTDPPYNGKFQWNHDMLNELHRVARQRIIFQHHFSPVNKEGKFKKAHVWHLTEGAIVPEMPLKYLKENKTLLIGVEDGEVIVEDDGDGKTFDLTDLAYWQPRTYFGRVQLISILDNQGATDARGNKTEW